MEENQKVDFVEGERVMWVRRVFATVSKPRLEVEVTFLYFNKRARIRLDGGAERNVQLSSLRKIEK